MSKAIMDFYFYYYYYWFNLDIIDSIYRACYNVDDTKALEEPNFYFIEN
jgi:hypothetical protein